MKRRSAGILLHPSSLPGPYAIGDLGPSAHLFLNWLVEAGQCIWQVLPLGPTGSGFSPYAALSSFAGDRLLISPELLVRDGLLNPVAAEAGRKPREARIDHRAAEREKNGLLRSSWRTFQETESHELREDFQSFLDGEDQASWLNDWCLYASIRSRCDHRGWWHWPKPLRHREPEALLREREHHADDLEFHAFVQFLFHRQWTELREKAAKLEIRLLGDLPIYAALDSADTWSRPELFDLDDELRPRSVAGVPPDYFSEDGQLWGNPIYRWQRHAEDGYAWWIERISANLRLVDLLRIDHFRGFESYWAVPTDHETARDGKWKKGPGMHFFAALRKARGDLPLIAEDLGEITAEVRELREASGLPGMRVLQFGFGDYDSEHAPHRYTEDTVAYTGTHDNDTLLGWFRGQDPASRRRILRYTGGRKRRIHWDLVRLLLTSSAGISVVPIQDVLGLGSEARMNVPGREGENWSYRLLPGELSRRLARRLCRLTELSGRKVVSTE